MKDKFNAAADGTFRKPENRPDPVKVAEAGIKTKESLEVLAARQPKTPTPSYDIDNEAVRQASLEQERARQLRQVNWMRERLRERPEKARRDFGTARDYRGEDRER